MNTDRMASWLQYEREQIAKEDAHLAARTTQELNSYFANIGPVREFLQKEGYVLTAAALEKIVLK